MHVISRLSYLMGIAGLVGAGALGGCGPGQGDRESQISAVTLAMCGLEDGTVEHHARLHACDPSETHKTTICHLPPGNPANAHTLCIGNAAVDAHLRNHGDYLGPCKVEAPCLPPSTDGTAGSGGETPATGGAAGSSGSGGSSGAGGSGETVGAGGSSGSSESSGEGGAGGQPGDTSNIVY